MKAKEPKEMPANNNINTNNNINNVHVHMAPRKKSAVKKKSEPNWYIRTIMGGIIALILSVGGYYLKMNLDEKSQGDSSSSQPDPTPIETTKHN